MKAWIDFSFLVKMPYLSISKGSVVEKDGEFYIVKRIDSITLLDEAVGEPGTVKVNVRGVKLP